MSKTLVAYYSRAGENYFGGAYKSIEVGNTAVIAKIIADETHGDIFEIKSAREYSNNYTKCTEEAKEDLHANLRPQLIDDIQNIDQYDTIYLGYPMWWGTCPMPVFTFLEAHDFQGKKIVPFCTHEGSGLGSSTSDIKKSTPHATVTKGFAIVGSNVHTERAKASVISSIHKQ